VPPLQLTNAPDSDIEVSLFGRSSWRCLGSISMALESATAAVLIALVTCSEALGQQAIAPAAMPRLCEVDARFQSYNIEMVEVTGGRFWKPYAQDSHVEPDRDIYAYRPPIDLANARLRRLAAALSPAYLRVSGTWANATYFADSDASSGAAPAGYNSVLTRAQWRGVVDFARAVDAEIVTSFAVSPGTRDAGGVWMPEQARRLLAYTRSLGGRIAAAEFMNEPNLAAQNGAPPGYDAAAYGRDFRIFRETMNQASPATLILGPGSVGESASAGMRISDLLAAGGPDIDVVSYHHYGTVSPRCGGRDRPDDAMSDEWLSRTDTTLGFYKRLRDQFAPGKPIWLSETADAACGGNPWDATFLDSFRYLDQLGRLAKGGVQVVLHNTLAASDYGLLDERSFVPRPNYWAALLWHRLMGTTVLEAGVPTRAGLRVHAHCDPARSGGITVLAINASRDRAQALALPLASERYTIGAPSLQSSTVQLNGRTLALGAGDALPDIVAVPTQAGVVTFGAATITFLAIPSAANPACR
jgi:Glycosyl hydrolase family 79, N-terminal domain